MQALKAITLIAICAIIMVASFATSSAITGNYQADSTPYIGIVVLFSDAERTQALSYSTGVLISPTVVLTAGHSVAGGVAASVCFGQGPFTYTMDKIAKMSYNTNQPIYNGIPITYPDFAKLTESGANPKEVLQTSDVGLIILDNPVQEVDSFPILPASGLADTLSVHTSLCVAGYGAQYQITPRDQGSFNWAGTISRNAATVELLSTDFQGSTNYLKCTANAAQGKGGVAYGDSGGPVLYTSNGESVVLAINALVNNANCAGVTYHTRIDNPQVLNWINGYL